MIRSNLGTSLFCHPLAFYVQPFSFFPPHHFSSAAASFYFFSSFTDFRSSLQLHYFITYRSCSHHLWFFFSPSLSFQSSLLHSVCCYTWVTPPTPHPPVPPLCLRLYLTLSDTVCHSLLWTDKGCFVLSGMRRHMQGKHWVHTVSSTSANAQSTRADNCLMYSVSVGHSRHKWVSYKQIRDRWELLMHRDTPWPRGRFAIVHLEKKLKSFSFVLICYPERPYSW